MKRLIWLMGTFAIGTLIAVGSWLAVRDILPGPALAAQPPTRIEPAQPAAVPPQVAPAAGTNFNDNEAPPHTGEPEKEETFIGSLRQLIEDTPELQDELKDHTKTLEEAEREYLLIKRHNEEAWKRVNRRPPISVPQSPNFIVIDAPGIGYADLASYTKSVEPDQAIDRLAQTGLVFTHYYTASSSPRVNSCSLMTGLHSGRTRIRGEEPNLPLALDDITTAKVLWRAGYATGMLGVWGLGGANSSGAPTRQGFEEAWFTDAQADDAELLVWNDLKEAEAKDQPADMTELRESLFNRTIGFVDRHRTQPFFVYLSLPGDADSENNLAEVNEQVADLTTAITEMNLARETYFFLLGSAGKNIPASERPEEPLPPEPKVTQLAKAPTEVPAEPQPPAVSLKIVPGATPPPAPRTPSVEIIENKFPVAEEPEAVEPESTEQREEVAPAAAEDAVDDAVESNTVVQARHVMDLQQLQRETALQVAGLRGELGDLYEGGLRAPLIVWTTKRPLGGVRNDVVAAWDLLPTLAGLSYSQFVPTWINGVPFSDRLQVQGPSANLPLHPALYWEAHGDGFSRAFLYGHWKLIQLGEDGPVSLYNLANDPEETRDVSSQQSELVEKLTPLLDQVRTRSRHWPREGEAEK